MLGPVATLVPRCARSARRAAIALHQDVDTASGLSGLDHTEGVLPSRHGQINGAIARELNEDPRIAHLAFAICCFAAAMTFSEVKPNFFCSSFSGAEAPNVSMPML